MQHVSILRAGYALALAFILYAALAPTAPTDGFTSDKLNHMAAFFVLAAGARILWPGASALRLILLLILLGAGIELMQMAMGLGRQGDWLDLAADIVATLAGVIVGSLAGRLLAGRLIAKRP
jgi:membrane associated rhomboid family serine protease